jgi:hypothetical protein
LSFFTARRQQAVEALQFMHCSKRFGSLVVPIFLSTLLLVAQSRAQSAQDPGQSGQPQPTQAEPPAQSQTQPMQSIPAQTPAERAQVLKEAQSRVHARRQQRVAQIVQDTYSHKFEAYFGGGYLRFRPGTTLQHINEAAWNVGLTDYLHGKLGITADFRGYYGTAYTYNNPFNVHAPSISEYTFMAGPQYRFYAREHWAASVQALAGAGHGNFDTNTGGLPGPLINLWPDATTFNVSVGVPIDYNLGPGLAVRLTPNYLLTDYGSTLEHNLGFNAGIVYRFGRQ